MVRVNSLTHFIEEVQKSSNYFEVNLGISMLCYRGESKKHDIPGIPNLFRNQNFKNFKGNGFEKNILDEVITNKLSENKNYLQTAMNAQHGGFPSRLLDVSFNSLIALFFAVTPHFNNTIDSSDDEDGVVLIYAIDKMYSSNTETIQKYFEDILNGRSGIDRIHGYVHRLIDYTNLNERIKAQQGGLILFSGNNFIPIPNWKTKTITINNSAKKKIRTELKQLFGMTMGSIYPESENLVEYLTDKALLLTEKDDYLELLYDLDKQLDYFSSEFHKIFEKNSYEDNIKFLMQTEKYLMEYAYSLNEIEYTEEFKNFKISACERIKYFSEQINYLLPEKYSFISIDKLFNIGGK